MRLGDYIFLVEQRKSKWGGGQLWVEYDKTEQ